MKAISRKDEAVLAAGTETGGPWHALPAETAVAQLESDAQRGLAQAEAQRRLEQGGANRLQEVEEEPLWEEFLEELREPLILLLLATGVLYAIWGDLTDALTIFLVILTLAGIEFYNEQRAKKAIDALREMAEPTTSVRRGGVLLPIATEEVVPGDLLLLEAGRRVPADARLLDSYGLAVDESALTGESVPVSKEAEVTLGSDTPLAERCNMVFAGTTATRGRGRAVVVATGAGSELGRVAELAGGVEAPETPLQQAMRELSSSLVWVALGFSLLVPVLGWLLTDQSPQQLALTGLSLAFATIPEEMPIIITMVLALGAYRLSRQHAVVKDLEAVETLGAVTAIATDKTGTLTRNEMAVTQLWPEEQATTLRRLGALVNDAVASNGDFSGDPLDVALLRAASGRGVDISDLRNSATLLDENTFDNSRKRMSVVYRQDGQMQVAVKGAPEAIVSRANRQQRGGAVVSLDESGRAAILEQAAALAARGLRVLGVAERTAEALPLSQQAAESDLVFVGLVGFADPARPEAAEAIAATRNAGIRPLMITGDHPLTARTIAREIGLDGANGVITGPELDQMTDEALVEVVGEVAVYARTTPEHKLRIVRALHARGERVAVTGDGINDAPALVGADIGVAMGETGTDVAREAGDIVLADDNFATIVSAIHEGRVLFANLKKGVRYYLAVKVALVSITLLATLLAVPVPFAPIQIILMELFMDLAAAATFVAEPEEAGLMAQPPRDPQARFMDRAMILSIFVPAVGLFAAVSAAYLSTWFGGAALARAQTIAFATWLLGHVLLALNMRSEREPLLRLGLFSNRLMLLWALATVAFILVATLVPPVQDALHTVMLTLPQWGLVVSTAVLGTFWLEVVKWVRT